MSCANMGISQLECLQLRRLVGPAGIGYVTYQFSGASVPITLNPPFPDGVKEGSLNTAFVVPSGTGMMRVGIQTIALNGNDIFDLTPAVYYYRISTTSNGQVMGTVIPLRGQATAAEGVANWYYEGIMIYNNPSSQPSPITLTVGVNTNTTISQLVNWGIDTLSFGPYVQQD